MIAYVEAVPAESKKNPCDDCLCGGSSLWISKRIRPIIMWRQFPPNLKKNPPQNYVIMWRQFPPNLKKIHPKFMWRQFPQNLKKNLPQNFREGRSHRISKRIRPQNYIEAVPVKSQKESAPKLCGGSCHQILKRIRPKIMWRELPHYLEKNPPQIFSILHHFPSIQSPHQLHWTLTFDSSHYSF